MTATTTTLYETYIKIYSNTVGRGGPRGWEDLTV